jgi:Predicted integral membrane protein
MKCEIIQDLLPSYVDGLCSNASRTLITEHLSTCKECQTFLANISSNLESKAIDEQEIDQYIEEKKLVTNSKKKIHFDIFCKILKILFYTIIILNIICVIIEYVNIKYGYQIKYPQIFFNRLGSVYLVLIFINILPLIISSIGIIVLNRKKNKKILIISSILIIPSILVCLSCGFILCSFPPIQSYTDKPENYLIVEKNVGKYSKIYENFFPNKIPNNANNVKYNYKKYEGLFEENIELIASWSLASDEYEMAKQKVLNSSYLEKRDYDHNSFKVYLKGLSYPNNLQLIFTYNDKEKTVFYSAIVNK